MKKTALVGAALLIFPFVASAQTLSNVTTLVSSFNGIVQLLIPIVIGIEMLAFFWGLFQYITKAGSEGHEMGIKIMVAGIAALFITVSIWGIIGFAQSSLGISNTQQVTAPRMPSI